MGSIACADTELGQRSAWLLTCPDRIGEVGVGAAASSGDATGLLAALGGCLMVLRLRFVLEIWRSDPVVAQVLEPRCDLARHVESRFPNLLSFSIVLIVVLVLGTRIVEYSHGVHFLARLV